MKKILDFVERNLCYIMLLMAALGVIAFFTSCSSDDTPLEETPSVPFNIEGTTWEYSFEDNIWMIDKMVIHFVDDNTVEGWYEGRSVYTGDFVKYDVVSCKYTYDAETEQYILLGYLIFEQFDIDKTFLSQASLTDKGLIVLRSVIFSFGLNKDSDPILFSRRL